MIFLKNCPEVDIVLGYGAGYGAEILCHTLVGYGARYGASPLCHTLGLLIRWDPRIPSEGGLTKLVWRYGAGMVNVMV